MALTYLMNEVDNTSTTPNDLWRESMQAFIDEEWSNTAIKTPQNGGAIYEQAEIGSSTYDLIEAWVKAGVGESVTGMKFPEDFLKILFHDIDHTTTRGLMYKFDDQVWIVTSYTHFNGLSQDSIIRRCNNNLRMIDPTTGAVFSIPCVVDYYMMAPMMQVSRYVSTPNGHINVIVQGNADTHRLFTLNTRFLLDGRPWKLFSFQDSLEASASATGQQQSTILYLDLYLDEIHDEDDLVNGVADNGTFQYDLAIDADDMELTVGTTMDLTATVTLNGEEVSKTVEWSSNLATVEVENGHLVVGGSVGDVATITATLAGNSAVSDSITVTVADSQTLPAVVILNPQFDKVRQYETIAFDVKLQYNGATVAPTTTSVTATSSCVEITQGSTAYSYYITTLTPCQEAITINVSATNSAQAITATQSFTIHAVSMMG